MTDDAFVEIDGKRWHRGALPEPKDGPDAIREARLRAWGASDGMPPAPIDGEGNEVLPLNAAEAERIEQSYWQRRLWSDPAKKSKVPPPQLGISSDQRLVVTEAEIAKEMRRLAPNGVFGYDAYRDLLRRATEAAEAKLRAEEIACGTVQGWVDRDAQERKRYSCCLCGASSVGLLRRPDGAWQCVTCAKR